MTIQQLGFDIDQNTEPENLKLPDAEISLHHQFYQAKEADQLLTQIIEETPWQQDHLVFAGKKVLIPRLQAWMGDANSDYAYSGLTLTTLPWTPCLSAIKDKLENFTQTKFNSVLLNYYRNGQDSVAWHSDNEKELGPEPLIASISLGVSRRFDLKHNKRQPSLRYSCQLDHGSLLIMGKGMQQHWQHQLPKQQNITLPRINLTFRKIIL